MAKNGFSYGRAITLDITAAPVPIDGIKALLEKIQFYEDEVAAGRTPATVLAGSEVTIVATSKTQYRIYAFAISYNAGTGVYTAELTDTQPNTEGLS